MLTQPQVLALTDSVSQGIADFQAMLAQIASGTPSMNSIINGVSGTGAANTVGRVLQMNDLLGELNLLPSVYQSASAITAYLNGLKSNLPFYTFYFPFFDKLDQNVGGLNAYLSTQNFQVSGYFAAAWNYWCSTMTSLTLGRSSFPVPLSAANYYPIAAVDGMYTFSCGSGTSMVAQSTGVTTASVGGGVGQCQIYKSNAGNAVGGATFSITYLAGNGSNVTTTYSTTSGVPVGAGSLATAYTIPGCIAQSILFVAGVGMTSNEQYTIGMRLPRTLQGY